MRTITSRVINVTNKFVIGLTNPDRADPVLPKRQTPCRESRVTHLPRCLWPLPFHPQFFPRNTFDFDPDVTPRNSLVWRCVTVFCGLGSLGYPGRNLGLVEDLLRSHRVKESTRNGEVYLSPGGDLWRDSRERLREVVLWGRIWDSGVSRTNGGPFLLRRGTVSSLPGTCDLYSFWVSLLNFPRRSYSRLPDTLYHRDFILGLDMT